MNNKWIYLILVISLVLMGTGCGKKEEPTKTPAKEDKVTEKKGTEKAAKPSTSVIADYAPIEKVKSQMKKLAPVEIKYDDSGLTDNQKKCLSLIVKAAKYMDEIFMVQVYGKNPAIMGALKANKDNNPDFPVLLDWFKVHFGPFDRVDHHKAFINTNSHKPKGANYYPEDMTVKEFEDHIKANPKDEPAFTSNFTIIRRKEGKLVAIPYNEAYKKYLEPAAKLMKEAAELADNPTLKKFLISRADAFASNDYYQSDIDWMDLKDHDIELVIGPYEVYEDENFGYKAAFESFVTIVDKKASKTSAVMANYIVEMEKNLPIDDKYKNFNRGKSSPIMVVNEVFTGGDTKAGIQTTAFNLPNDERVREAKGSKKVMLKNIAEAKFQNCWVPIVKEVLAEDVLPHVSFDAYFNHVLMHEMAHGLGPGNIIKDGKKTSVNKELKDLYSTIEEAKADIVGVWSFLLMIEKGVFPKEMEKNLFASYLGGTFRSIRFGINEAHGGGVAIQFNYMVEKGVFIYNEKTGRYSLDETKIKDAVKQLSHDLLMIEANGDYEAAKKLIEKYRKISPELAKALKKVEHVPTDIKPVYAIEKTLKD